MAMDTSPEDGTWVPDMRTVRWAAAQVEVESLARAIAHDVPLRVNLPSHLSPDVWLKAADAAYEATWWPIVQAAERMNGIHRDGD